MPYERTGFAPWSLTREAGVQSATVDGTVQVPQYIQPTLNTGFIDEKGNWKGVKSSDENFIAFTKDESIGNGDDILTPTTNPDGTWPLDMTGYKNMFLAINPTQAGNYAIKAIMGPDTVSFANLSPVAAGENLRGFAPTMASVRLDDLLNDPADSLTANVWNIFYIKDNLAEQKLLQFKITNNTGSTGNIECAYMRIV